MSNNSNTSGTGGSRAGRLAVCAAFAACLLGTGGCSLISLKSPEKPLSTRDLNARILTREYSAHVIAAVGQTADAIAADSADPAIRLDALRWKISAAGRSQRAASQMAPMMSLLDSWALSVQMADYFTTGAGQNLFGSQQPRVQKLTVDLAAEAASLAERLTAPDEFTRDRSFVEQFAHANPLTGLSFTRPSFVEAWTQKIGTGTKLVDSLGTVPEALADAGDRIRMYGDTGPQQLLWQAQLAAQQSGISSEDLRTAMRRLDERMDQVATLVGTAPKTVDGLIRRADERFNASWADVIRDVHAEQLNLSATVSSEREAALAALDLQRTALAADANRIAAQVVHDTGEQVRALVREALMLVIALAIVVLGVPFIAGYLVGRAQRRARPPSPNV